MICPQINHTGRVQVVATIATSTVVGAIIPEIGTEVSTCDICDECIVLTLLYVVGQAVTPAAGRNSMTGLRATPSTIVAPSEINNRPLRTSIGGMNNQQQTRHSLGM